MKLLIDNYELDLSASMKQVQEESPKRVLIQLPDGFKYSSKKILDAYKQKFPDVQFYCWLNTNYGSCDMPLGLDKLKFDLLLHFGHAQWR